MAAVCQAATERPYYRPAVEPQCRTNDVMNASQRYQLPNLSADFTGAARTAVRRLRPRERTSRHSQSMRAKLCAYAIFARRQWGGEGCRFVFAYIYSNSSIHMCAILACIIAVCTRSRVISARVCDISRKRFGGNRPQNVRSVMNTQYITRRNGGSGCVEHRRRLAQRTRTYSCPNVGEQSTK